MQKYPAGLIAELLERHPETEKELLLLAERYSEEGEKTGDSELKSYLQYGLCRRIQTIRATLANIFRVFPPYFNRPLTTEERANVEINLHAYVINLSGLFDNWAWAFILKHDLLHAIGGKHQVGMFRKKTREHLPNQLQTYIDKNNLEAWHTAYVKDYRDALAHRVPLYLPPKIMTPIETERFKELEAEKLDKIVGGDHEAANRAMDEQEALGEPCFAFMIHPEHSVEPIFLHPQLLSDARAMIEFGIEFLTHWSKCNKDM
jgi:hypothetical protein